MRVLVIDPILSSLPYDRALCGALAAEGHHVKIVGRALRTDEAWTVQDVDHIALPIEDVIRQTTLSGQVLKFYTLLRHLRYSVQIQKIATVVRAFRPDVIHFQWCLTPLAEHLLLWQLSRDVVTILTVHDTTPFNGSRVSSFVTRGLPRLMASFDHLIAHTRAAANILADHGHARERLSVVPHGLLRSPVTGMPDSGSSERAAAKQHVTCLLFGHVKHYKGVDVLIRAAAAMSKPARDKIRFVIAGQLGVDFEELRRLCVAGGVLDLFRFHLRFFPETEVDGVMRDADIFVFPYREIQASGVFTLALGYGRPVVASKLGIFADQIVDGVNGFLVPPEDPEALARALERLCDDVSLRTSMGEANIVASRAYPSWREIARLTTEAYAAALSRKRSSQGHAFSAASSRKSLSPREPRDR